MWRNSGGEGNANRVKSYNTALPQFLDFRIQKGLDIMNSPSGMTLEKFKLLWQQIPIPSELSTFTHRYDEDED